MPVWGWIAIVAGAWLAVSVVVSFLLARMFGAIERASDEWASKPLTRETGKTITHEAPTREAASSPRPR